MQVVNSGTILSQDTRRDRITTRQQYQKRLYKFRNRPKSRYLNTTALKVMEATQKSDSSHAFMKQCQGENAGFNRAGG